MSRKTASRPRTAFSRPRRGVTLVEVLATMVLIGIVLPVVMQGVSLSMSAAARARHRTEAVQLATLKASEFLVLRDVNSFSGSGDFGEDWPEYRWESQAASSDYGLYRVDVRVIWMERGQERAVALSTLVYPHGTVTW